MRFKQLIEALVGVLLLGLYGLVFVLLFADSLPVLWIVFILLCHVFYSVAVIFVYAYAKVKAKQIWCLALIPLLTTTSVLGIVLWKVMRPKKRIQNWLVR